MITKKVISPDRIRKISGSFAFIEHRFLRAGFWTALSHHELLLYLLLVVVAGRATLPLPPQQDGVAPASQTTKATAIKSISGLVRTASVLAVYASRFGFP
jgi:hypothetical protein